ncbi:MAG: leucine-rich repeat protein [Ruminococcus sp.]|nr:leucine-rich repeat protein [Ruminococcus sp.]
MKKKVLSALLALALVFSSAAALPKSVFTQGTSITASAESETQKSGDYEYRVLDNGTAEITKYSGKAETLNIPSTLGGKTVSSIGMMAFAGCSCKSVTIPNSVTNIEIAAFERCTKLTSIIIPNSMTYIGRSMFNFCISLKTVNIPNSVTTIGASAFVNCSNLESVKIPSGLKGIGDGAFANCEKLKSITIPSGVTYLGMYAFQDCKSLTSVTIPNGITKIASGVFLSCTGLSNVSIPSSVTSIEYQAFSGCTSLTSVTIPNGVTEIGNCAFQDCTMLTSLTIPSSVESIGNDAIDKKCKIICEKGSKAEKYAKDNGLDYNYSDGDYLYKELADGNVEITGYKGKASALSIPSTLGGKKVTTIGVRAFKNCTSIKSVTIPDSVTSIAIYAFQSCSGLTSITIPNGVKIIKASTFQNCTGLTSVTIPKSVTEIEPQAFLNCDSLKTVTIPSSVVKISDHAFGYRAYNTTVYTISKVEGFTINCFKNTEGEDYAKKNGFKYTAVLEKSRLAGDNRYATATEIAKKAYPSGAKTVILASGMTYADALVGVPLANKLNAPILLAAKDSLPRETTNALEKLGAKKVIILGGKGAVSEQVEITLKNQGITTERYEGGTRFGTATAIAEKLNENPTDVFFVYYNGFPDALSASTAAALKNAPIIYLTTDGDMNADTAAYLAKLKKAGSIKNAYIIGGTGVITDNMLKKVGTALGVTPKRLDGKDRYETCVAVNNEFKSLLSGKSICVATGADYPDALAGGVFAAIQKAPLFLINGKAQTLILSDKQKAYLKTLTPNMMYVLGGIGVVPDSHVKTVADAWG